MKNLSDTHSPLPWVVRLEDDGDVRGIFTAERIEQGDANSKWTEFIQIVETDNGYYPPSNADAEFLVRACNVHYELLEFIKNIRPFLGNDSGATLHKQADALIAKAEGRKGVATQAT